MVHTDSVAIPNRSVGLVWFRRDLRLDANPAWSAATAAHDDVVAVFVLEPDLLEPAGRIRRDQLFAHLLALDAQLRSLGGNLVVRNGPARFAIPQALADASAEALYYNVDASPYATARDLAVATASTVPVHRHDGLTVHAPGAVLTKKATVSQVFTPFYRTWMSTEWAEWPISGPASVATLDGVAIPKPSGPVRQPPGEVAAWERANAWLESVDDYLETRDVPAIAGTSDLSADLKFGTLAARTLVEMVGTGTAGRDGFVRQLAWRDWWAHLLAERPGLAVSSLKPRYDAIAWRDDDAGFDRWCAGRTGFPIVDAGMRQLVETGWMHNRVRMICASFLVKDLLIDWRRGERFFRHHLVDADRAQNVGNWQWVAGTGPDAAPYFRVFNPTAQGQRFDPDGTYIRRWVPELRAVSGREVHAPFVAEPTLDAGSLGGSYPPPMLDHAAARRRAIDAYRRAVNQ